MNGRIAKKIRKNTQHNFFEYVQAVKGWPFGNRLRLCWYILFGREKKPKKVSRSQVLKNRRPVKKEGINDLS